MRYEEFRDRLEHALRESGIPFSHFSRKETIELPVPSRVYEITIGMEEGFVIPQLSATNADEWHR